LIDKLFFSKEQIQLQERRNVFHYPKLGLLSCIDIKVKIGVFATLCTVVFVVFLCTASSFGKQYSSSLSSAPLKTPLSQEDIKTGDEVLLIRTPEDFIYRIHKNQVVVRFSPESFTIPLPNALHKSQSNNLGIFEEVNRLTLSSPMTQNTLHYILQRFRNIETLDIDVDAVCSGFQVLTYEEINSLPIEFPNLQSLTLSNGIHCPVFDWGFLLNAPKVNKIIINRFNLNPDNFQALYNTLSRFEHSVTTIFISRSYIQDNEVCDLNKFMFLNVKLLSVTERCENESYLIS